MPESVFRKTVQQPQCKKKSECLLQCLFKRKCRFEVCSGWGNLQLNRSPLIPNKKQHSGAWSGSQVGQIHFQERVLKSNTVSQVLSCACMMHDNIRNQFYFRAGTYEFVVTVRKTQFARKPQITGYEFSMIF